MEGGREGQREGGRNGRGRASFCGLPEIGISFMNNKIISSYLHENPTCFCSAKLGVYYYFH